MRACVRAGLALRPSWNTPDQTHYPLTRVSLPPPSHTPTTPPHHHTTGYYNPFLNYGAEKLMDDVAAAGGDGFIVVDLPPEEGSEFVRLCASRQLSYVPLLTPTTADSRLAYLGK